MICAAIRDDDACDASDDRLPLKRSPATGDLLRCAGRVWRVEYGGVSRGVAQRQGDAICLL
jgi:hypothetical protein